MKSALPIIFSITFYLLFLTISQASFYGSPEILNLSDENNCRPPASVFSNADNLYNHLMLYKFQGSSRQTHEVDCNFGWKGPECIVKSPPLESNTVTFFNSRPLPIVQKICITGYFFYEIFDVKLFFDNKNLRNLKHQDLHARLGKNYRNLIEVKKTCCFERFRSTHYDSANIIRV